MPWPFTKAMNKKANACLVVTLECNNNTHTKKKMEKKKKLRRQNDNHERKLSVTINGKNFSFFLRCYEVISSVIKMCCVLRCVCMREVLSKFMINLLIAFGYCDWGRSLTVISEDDIKNILWQKLWHIYVHYACP